LSLVVSRARLGERGAATAFFTTLDWVGLLVAGPVVGFAIERAGYSAAFMGLGLLLVIGMAVFYGLDRGGEITMVTSRDSTAPDASPEP
jgi:hypothetical protein